MLHYTILYHTIVYYVTIYYAMLYYNILYYTILYCTKDAHHHGGDHGDRAVRELQPEAEEADRQERLVEVFYNVTLYDTGSSTATL